ncbi:unnamed protein product [Pedinophyceae sp. YPF-701]|nr:unnamed protein product [Pedinophyceae sp. YPF-701]
MIARASPVVKAQLGAKPSCGAKAVQARPAAPRARRSVRVRAEAADDAVPIEKSGNNFAAVKDIDEIMTILPHRFPFLLVDRVVHYEAQQRCVAIKNVTINDNFFPGHFPERPIMPGVLMVEAMAQVGGIAMLDPEDKASKNNFFFGGIDSCKFRKPVTPGDTLVMDVRLQKFNKRFGIAKMEAKGYVGDALVVEAVLTLVVLSGDQK